jgi:hypothetical protein
MPNDITLQLRPRPRLLQNRVQLRRPHNISLNLQLASHEQLLRIRFALHELSKVLVAQHHRDSRFLALGRKPFADGTRLLEINVP